MIYQRFYSLLQQSIHRGGHGKIAQKQGGQLKGGEVLLERVVSKACFHYYRNTFFCLVNIHTCCNQQIYSFMWFTFYQKMIHYGISFPLTLIFKYDFVKILLLMTFIFISISLQLQIFLKINHRCLKEAIAQLLYIMIVIIMNLKFKTQQRYYIKSKNCNYKKNTNQIDKS